MKPLTDKAIVVGLLVFSLAEGLSHYGLVHPDSPSYMVAAHFFQGKPINGAAQFRLLRPVVPFLASLLNHFVDIRASFAVLNLVLWCAAAVLMFYFTRMITKDTDASLLAAALFTSAIPMLLFADAVLTDMAGYLFILLGIYMVIKWDLPRANLRRVSIASLIMAVGVLALENVASVLIFAFVWTILSRGSIRRILVFALIPIGIALLWSSAVGVSYVAWYTQGGLAFSAANQQLGSLRRALRLLGSVQYDFGRYPEIIALAALGFLRIKDKNTLKIHISIWVGALAVILAWPIVDSRFTFILFPSILPLAGVGLQEAYAIIFKSRFISAFWPSFRDSRKSRYIFLLLVIAAYAVITNLVLRGYISFPWKPYTDPSVRPIDIQ